MVTVAFGTLAVLLIVLAVLCSQPAYEKEQHDTEASQ